MKHIILIILLISILILSGCAPDQTISLSDSSIDVECPRGVINDPFPGQCGQYTDKDGNDICDLSE